MRAIVELEWFFNHAAANMGISSNYASIINAGLGLCQPTWQDTMTDQRMASIERYRKIEIVFHKLSSLYNNL